MSEADLLDRQPPVAEDELRSQLYKLLAYFLHKPADADGLKMASEMQGDDTDLGKAITAFALIASKSAAETITQEYHDLFIGVGRGEQKLPVEPGVAIGAGKKGLRSLSPSLRVARSSVDDASIAADRFQSPPTTIDTRAGCPRGGTEGVRAAAL